MLKKFLSISISAVMLSSLILLPASASESKINAWEYPNDSFIAYEENEKNFLLCSGDEPGEVTITFNAPEKAIYSFEICGGLYFDTADDKDYWSQMTYSLDGGDAILINSDSAKREEYLDYGWLGTYFSRYSLNETYILSEGEHTLTFNSITPCEYDGWYASTIEYIKLNSEKITTDFEFSGRGGDFSSSVSYSGGTAGFVHQNTAAEYKRTLNFNIGEAGYYDLTFDSLMRYDSENAYASEMNLKIDDEKEFLLSSETCYHTTGKSLGSALSAGTIFQYRLGEPVWFEVGAHTIEFIVRDPNPNGTRVGVLGKISLNSAFARDMVIEGEDISSKSEESEKASGEKVGLSVKGSKKIQNYKNDDYSLDVVCSKTGLPFTITIDGNLEIEVNEETFTDAQLDDKFMPFESDWVKLRMNEKLPIETGEHNISVSGGDIDYIAFRYARNIKDIEVPETLSVKTKSNASFSITDENGNALSTDDVFSYSFVSSDEENISVEAFAEVSAKRSGAAEITVKIVTDTESSPIIKTVGAFSVRDSGCYVKNAYISGNTLNVTTGGTDGAVRVLAGRRNSKTLSDFVECKTISISAGNDAHISFSEIGADEEIVIFLTDENGRHIYGKTIVK